MDKITPDMMMTFLVVAAGLIGFVMLIWGLIDKIKAARKPNEETARWRHETDTKLAADKKRLDSMEQGFKVMCRGILALQSHEINGNSIDKLKASQKEITDYLIDR